MRAMFFAAQLDGGVALVSMAMSRDPVREFKLLVLGKRSDPFLFKVYGNAPPELPADAFLGVGRTPDEAQRHVILTAENVRTGV